jgi:periplasmic protein CpxP/Spy
MRNTTALVLIVTVVSSVPGVARELSAQRLERRPARTAEQAAPPGAPLGREFRERLAEVVRRRLNLNDTQMRQLRQVNDRVERERMQLLRDERQVRVALRGEMLAGDSADQDKVATLLDEALRIQRRRLDLVEQEQRALSGFMTPLQRAQYFAIQDDLRRRLEDIRQQRQQRQLRRPGMPPPGGASPKGRPRVP